MSNATQPAFPSNKYENGLTKREFIATLILAGGMNTSPGLLPQVDDAVRLADRLLAKLEEKS